MRTRIPVENNDTLAAVRGFLKQLLETEVVDALLVPMETPAGTVTPALVSVNFCFSPWGRGGRAGERFPAG